MSGERKWITVQLSIELAQQILSMVLICLTGFALCKVGLLNAKDGPILSRVAVYAAAPCSIIQAYLSEFNVAQLSGFLMVVVTALILQFMNMGITSWMRKSPIALTPEESASALYSNAGNLGIPLIMGISSLGPAYVLYLSGYITVQTAAVWSHGLSLVSGQRQFAIGKVLKNPCIIALALGMVLFVCQVSLPSPVLGTISSLAACLGPLCMLVIGMSLSTQDFSQVLRNKRMYFAVALRLLILPLVALPVIFVMSLVWPHADVHNILIVCFVGVIGPVGSTVAQLAQIYDSPQVGYISVVNVVSTILCVVTMPVMIYLLQWVFTLA